MPSTRYRDTRTDHARDTITATVGPLVEAERALKEAIDALEPAVKRARDARDQALREAYAEGVEHRDLVELLTEAGGPLGRQQVARIVRGARNQDTA
jgi:hypothetical protein